MSKTNLTHLDQDGQSRMVDVGEKALSHRIAVAKAILRMSFEARQAIESPQSNPKGEVLQVARIAAIQGAKETSHLIPMCHQVPLTSLEVQFRWQESGCLEIECQSGGSLGDWG